MRRAPCVARPALRLALLALLGAPVLHGCDVKPAARDASLGGTPHVASTQAPPKQAPPKQTPHPPRAEQAPAAREQASAAVPAARDADTAPARLPGAPRPASAAFANTPEGWAAELGARALSWPVDGTAYAQVRDSYTDARGANPHEAMDVMAPRGTPVRALEDGRVVKLFLSKPGGLTVYQFDPSERFVYYYAHLDAYAEGLREGQWLRRGEVLGTVGSSGNASPDAPHLHLSIGRLDGSGRWWKSTPINPHPLFAWVAGAASGPPRQ